MRCFAYRDHFQTLEKPGSSFSWQSASLGTPVLACTRPVHPPMNPPHSDHGSSRWSLREESMFSRLINTLPGGSSPPCRLPPVPVRRLALSVVFCSTRNKLPNRLLVLSVLCMWVKSAVKTMTPNDCC
ncbi:hypothetical protein ATANTOWER_024067 [Ataeniobius toweri]|uniref:Uncharacterized protein n=1 Tax=Ataeniobius toweri TaxID=208326 RepID=A0ABU7BU89_9TELE|nr:hypothetical protein [Ataeniobius toweri]